MNEEPRRIRQFGLYGEGQGVIEPEFVHIETIAARSPLHNWAIAPHLHPGIFQLLLLNGGEGWLSTDGNEYRLKPTTLVVVPCGCVHAFRFTPKTLGWVLSIADSLVADPRLAALELNTLVHGGEVLKLPLTPNSPRDRLLASLLGELNQRHAEAPGHLGASTIALIGLVLATAGEIAESASTELAASRNRRLALVRRFTRLVEQHYGEHWPVDRYAAALGSTAPTLTRACREVTGKPPGRIALDRLLREAMRNLSFSTASISEISDKLGFQDPAYFARIFRKHSGVTAGDYRRKRVWLAGPDLNVSA